MELLFFVRHGGILVRVHSSRLNKVNRQQQEKQTVQDNTNNETKDEGSSLNKTAVGEQKPDTGVVTSSTVEQDTATDDEQDSYRGLNIEEVVHPPVSQTQMEIEKNVRDTPISFKDV